MLNFARNVSDAYTFWGGVIGGCFLTMASEGTDQLFVQRLLAAKTLRESRWALLSSGVVILVQFALFLAIGTGLYFFSRSAGAAYQSVSPDRVFPLFIVQYMPRGVAGLTLAAILAAAMSNLSAAVNSLSSTSIVDFYLYWRPECSEERRARVSRLMTVVWTAVLLVLALLSRSGGHVVELGLSIASVAYGGLLGVFLLGTLSKRANESGAMVGMIFGLAVNLIVWRQPHSWTISLAAVHFTLPKFGWTWYVLLGSFATFVVGWCASLLMSTDRPVRMEENQTA